MNLKLLRRKSVSESAENESLRDEVASLQPRAVPDPCWDREQCPCGQRTTSWIRDDLYRCFTCDGVFRVD